MEYSQYSNSPNDTEKYATYTRDSLTKLDYAMNRYYSSIWGRFLSPDLYGSSVSSLDPGSWNRYTYVGGDPVNGIDPLGLCTVLIGGITQAPGASAVTQTATKLGADSVYPYEGEDFLSSVGSVLGQASGPNSSTLPALNALLYALGSTDGSVDIIAYSGGAAAFTDAYSQLSTAQQARIGLVLYLSPGAAGSIADVSGTTRVVEGATQSADPLAERRVPGTTGLHPDFSRRNPWIRPQRRRGGVRRSHRLGRTRVARWKRRCDGWRRGVADLLAVANVAIRSGMVHVQSTVRPTCKGGLCLNPSVKTSPSAPG